eukprot:1551371-Ditylum_brightwellii.AAC.1
MWEDKWGAAWPDQQNFQGKWFHQEWRTWLKRPDLQEDPQHQTNNSKKRHQKVGRNQNQDNSLGSGNTFFSCSMSLRESHGRLKKKRAKQQKQCHAKQGCNAFRNSGRSGNFTERN